MAPVGSFAAIKFLHIILWIFGLMSCALFYFNVWPINDWTDWLMGVPLAILMGYLIIFDLAPSIIIRILDKIQDRVGYQNKFVEEELSPKPRSSDKTE